MGDFVLGVSNNTFPTLSRVQPDPTLGARQRHRHIVGCVAAATLLLLAAQAFCVSLVQPDPTLGARQRHRHSVG
eukprot:2068360-Ditylum_brightwellii.AAC.1